LGQKFQRETACPLLNDDSQDEEYGQDGQDCHKTHQDKSQLLGKMFICAWFERCSFHFKKPSVPARVFAG